MSTLSHLFHSIVCATILNCALVGTADAGLFGGDEDKSGLDFNRGYDVNTVSTVSGRVVSQPHPGEKEYLTLEIKSGTETLNVSVGPGSYWDKKGIPIRVNDDLSVKGSKAQGKDGKSYVLAQKVVNRTTGAQVELRNDNGEAAWSGKVNNMNNMRSQGGSMMRGGGGGMMRGGGGGMMRH